MREMPLPFVRVRIYDRLWLCGAKTVAATRTLNNCLPQHFLHHQRQSQPAFRCALSTIPAMAAAAIVLGGKGSALSVEAVYSVAHGKSKVQIDLSALQKMSNSAAAKSVYSQSKQNGADGTRFLSQEQSRAALVVLASKLLQSHVRPVIPLVIERALNNDMPLNLPVSNSGAAAAVAEMISSFRDGFQPGALDRVFEADLFVSIEEFNAMLASYCVTVGLAALSVYSSSVLSTVADAVAALSCEAVQVNVKGFDLEASVEGFSNKSEIDVASDLRTLLFGSKLVTLKNQGFEGDSSFFSVAPIHGCLREDLKIAQSKVRIDLNSVPNYKRALQESTQLMSLEKTILSLAMSLKAVGETSLLRADQIAKVFILCGGPSALELFLQKQNSVDSLQSIVQSVISKAVISNGNVDAGCIATEVLDLVQHLSHILSLESVCCLSLIALRERMATERGGQEPSITKENAGNLGKQKGEKKKKGGPEFVLGKGTNTIRQSMLNVFQNVLENHSDSVDFDKCLGASVRKFCSFFEPKNSNLQIMLDDVKKILESNETRRLPKIPKGTRDFKPEQMAIRERAFSIIAGVFKRHGAVALDTPVFELRETLMGKYGEDSKLIFDLADQGGEICSLRYDLTVPFARYLAMHNISSLKRYHIARVYRRDNPSKGRYREFYQCDFDIAGPCATMVYDFEVIKVLTELLDELKIGDYEVKLNHRKLLDGMLELCGVPESKFRSICSAIDKLDKQPWDQVEKEMIDEKGLTPDVAKKIGSIVLKKGSPLGMLSELKGEGSPFSQHSASLSTLEELETLFSFLEASGCLNKIVFDLSLARGLDYYTGVIYEAVFKGTTQVGSIAAGGRYDKLVGMFSGKQVPAVGVSLGIERVFTIMEQIEQENSNVIRATQTQVLLVVLGDDMRIAIRLVSELWSAKLNAEFALTSSRKIGKHIEDALKAGIPYMLLLGENELKKGVVKLKDLREKEETEITRDRIIDYLKSKLDANQVKDFVVVQ